MKRRLLLSPSLESKTKRNKFFHFLLPDSLKSLMVSAGLPPGTFCFVWVLFRNLFLRAGTPLRLTKTLGTSFSTSLSSWQLEGCFGQSRCLPHRWLDEERCCSDNVALPSSPGLVSGNEREWARLVGMQHHSVIIYGKPRASSCPPRHSRCGAASVLPCCKRITCWF